MLSKEESQLFDLNIKEVLSHWEVKDAIREFIANAMDETVLRKCRQPEVKYDPEKQVCTIRDYGRGLDVSHLTQNESSEKAEAEGVIGRFGVGLKDALAVLDKHGAIVSIDSRHMHLTLQEANKHGFEIPTLHAKIEKPKQADFKGTLISIEKVSQEDMLAAKEMFLQFNGAEILYKGDYGEIVFANGLASVYVNGLRVAEDESLLFSYNVTKLDSKLKKNLNRERKGVSRAAYTEAIKKILRNCDAEEVWDKLAADLRKDSSDRCAEIGWTDVCAEAAKHLDKSSDDHVFMTQEERNRLTADQVEKIEEQGRAVVIVSESAKGKALDSISTMEDVEEEYENSFEFKFVDPNSLSSAERDTWSDIKRIDEFVKKSWGKPIPRRLISETMMSDGARGIAASGVWSPQKQAIIIKRSELKSKKRLFGTLLHEYCHCLSGCTDNTRGFEEALTDMCGALAESLLKKQNCSDEPENHKAAPKKSFLNKLLKR